MIKRTNQVGFSQLVRLEWLEQTVSLVLAGHDRTAISEALQDMLKDRISVGSKSKRSNRDKTVSILRKIWVSTPEEIIPLKNDALAFLSTQKTSLDSSHLSLVIHWGMVMAVYPFWASVAKQVGRLLRLQGSIATAHIQRRIREQYGERETVSRSVRRVLGSFLDWGVLQRTGKKGIYRSGIALPVDDPGLIAWLVEAYLHSQGNGSASLRDLIDSPSLFPFRIKPTRAETLADVSPRLDFIRHGLDDNLVILKKPIQKRIAGL